VDHPIDEDTARRLVRALEEGRLDPLFQSAHVDYAGREGFAGTSVTLGLPREAVSELLGSVRRAQGLTVLTGAWGDYSNWITLNAELVELLHWVDIRAGFDYDASGLPDDEIRHLRTQILIEEVLPLGLDRGDLSPVDPAEFASAQTAARRMLQEGTEPATDYERWALRFFELMQRLPELSAQPLTVDRLRELHAMLSLDPALGGVYRTSEHTLKRTGASTLDGPGALPERIPDEMRAIAAYDTENPKPFVHPLIKAIMGFYWIRRVQPFAVANGLFARLVAHIYEYQQGYRTLPWTPLTRTQRSEWAVPPTDAGAAGFDATVFLVTRLHLFLNAYVEAEREVSTALQRTRGLAEKFQRLTINPRQARILDRALGLPTTVFTIRHHARSRGLAYETARQDFLQLVSAGYLEQTRRGRLFEFRLAQDGAKKLAPLLTPPAGRAT
jgi:Fic family protein